MPIKERNMSKCNGILTDPSSIKRLQARESRKSIVHPTLNKVFFLLFLSFVQWEHAVGFSTTSVYFQLHAPLVLLIDRVPFLDCSLCFGISNLQSMLSTLKARPMHVDFLFKEARENRKVNLFPLAVQYNVP